MATILITGKTELFTQESIEKLAEHYKVVIAGDYSAHVNKAKDIHVFHATPAEEKFRQLFDAYSISAVWYVSGYCDGGEGSFGEAQMLEQTMLECRSAGVDKVILLSTVESRNYLEQYGQSGEGIKKEYPSSRVFGAAQTEEIGRYFAEKNQMKTIILWLPYLADRINEKNFLANVFKKMYEKEKVLFPYHKEDRVDFLSLEDLLVLLVQITGETEDESGSYYAVSGYQYQYADLEALVKLFAPDVQVIYENYPNTTSDWPEYPVTLRKKYGFVPMDNVMENIGFYYRTYVSEVYGGKKGIFENVLNLAKKAGKGLFQYFELLIAFFAAELISHYTSDSVYFRFVDVRLFFIVVMGTVYGIRLGMAAALLECLALIRQYGGMGMNGVLLFYNIENWIPFVIYLMTGYMTGYIKNRNTGELAFSRKEYNLLRNKYIFLNDVYHGAIENKGEYKKQILGFKDSFGKIFDAVQKLDSELPQSIFLEGLHVMEDILENRMIAIYTLDSWQRFGRLAVCSSRLLTRLTKSIRIEEHPDMYQETSKGGVWKNTELKEGEPMYACGVFKGGSMVLLITIQEVSVQQYGVHYMNIFQILCGLVQTSFIRALEYEAFREEQSFYPGTHAVYPKKLHQLVGIQEDMKTAGVADYVLVKLGDRDKQKVSEELAGMIRASDTLGAGEDGSLYLLLVQMDRKNFHIVGERLDKKGIEYQLVEKVG